MTPEFAYFLKVNIAFALFYAFYRLFFYKDTFFKLRRSVLLAFFGLALIYPLFNIQDWIKEQEPIAEVILLYSSMIEPEATVTVGKVAESGFNWGQIFLYSSFLIYIGVALILVVRFILQLTSILWLAHQSEKKTILGIPVHSLDKPAGPFSFFKLIFIHPESHSEKETEEILIHERTHVAQWHSIDVIICEFISIVCWFNPFVWLLKREVRHNLEYLADNTVIESGYDSKSYQYHLLGLAHHHKESSSLYNSFNVLHLKNRIGMMNKKRSHGIGRTKYLVFVPLVAVLMLLSNIEAVARITREVAREITAHTTPMITVMGQIVDEMAFPIAGATVMEKAGEAGTSTDYDGRFELATYANNTLVILSEGMEIKELEAGELAENTPLILKEKEGTQQIFTVVEEMPQFPGGDDALMRYVNSNIRYPADALEKDIQGRVVVSFIVNKDGSLHHPEIVRGVSSSIDLEALRIIKNMPKWSPGKQRGRTVPVKYTLPINFRISEKVEEKTDVNNQVFTVVEDMPRFPGGDSELLRYITSSIRYPAVAQESGAQGRVVVSFVVEKDGSIANTEIVRGVDPILDEEALRVVSALPRWEPGRQRGKAVRVKYTMPIQFRLQ